MLKYLPWFAAALAAVRADAQAARLSAQAVVSAPGAVSAAITATPLSPTATLSISAAPLALAAAHPPLGALPSAFGAAPTAAAASAALAEPAPVAAAAGAAVPDERGSVFAASIRAAGADAPQAESAGTILFDGRTFAGPSAAASLALAAFTHVGMKPAPGVAFNAAPTPLPTATTHPPSSFAQAAASRFWDNTLGAHALDAKGGTILHTVDASIPYYFEFAFAPATEVAAWAQTKTLWIARTTPGVSPQRIDAAPDESFGPIDLSGGDAVVYFSRTKLDGAVVLDTPASQRRLPLDLPPTGLALSPNAALVAILTNAGAHGPSVLQLWDAARDLVRTYPAPAAGTRYLAGDRTGRFPMIFSPDGTRLAVASKTGEVLVYTVRNDALVDVLALNMPGANHDIQTLAWGADGRKLVGSTKRSAWYWDFAARQRVLVEDDADLLGASWDEAAQALIWVAKDGVYRATLSGGQAAISKIPIQSDKALLHPNGRSLLSLRRDPHPMVTSTTLRYVRLPYTPPPVPQPQQQPAQTDAAAEAVADLRREIMARAHISDPAALIRRLSLRLDGSDVTAVAAAKWLSELAAAGDVEAARALEAEAKRRQTLPQIRNLRTPLF